VAFAGLLLMYMAILTYGTWTLMGVTEEKTNRVVEVLLAAVEPWQLLAGKVLGIGMLGLAQFVLTVLFAVVTIRITGAFELPAIPTAALPMLIVWFLLGYTLYAVGFAAAGSLVSRMEDAQTVATPFTIMSVVGFFISIQTLDDPSGIVAQVTSFIPVTAPFAVPVRLAFGAIEWWELTLSVLLMVGAIAGLIRLAGKVYSGGLLRFGAKVSWREAFRAAEM
jgi:ABC-2 type transport system permease protein